MPLDIESEPYSHSGNMSAEGILKSLGAPTMDRLRILLRESVQNADDARIQGESIPSYKIGIRTLSKNQSDFLRGEILRDHPEDDPGSTELYSSIEKRELKVIEISDWATSGLGGPTRADKIHAGPEATDFIDFIRNIGSPRDTDLGGGTYGYGKSSLWINSLCKTICLHTSTEYMGEPVERFMASRIGQPFDGQETKFTGRHWWGKRAPDGVVDPVENEDAAKIAEELGIPQRSGSKEDRGTTLMIIDPDLGDRSPGQAREVFRESLLWFFWTKMLPQQETSLMKFTVYDDQGELIISNPSSIAPLNLMVKAYEKVMDINNAESEPITYGRARDPLGRIAIEKGLSEERTEFNTGDDEDDSLIPRNSCHIALMRRWGGIVKYHVGPPMPDGQVEYGGIFITDIKADDVFAKSEPPAHDDWVPNSLTGKDKGYVRTALRKIVQFLNDNILPKPGNSDSDGSAKLAPLAEKLGELLFGSNTSQTGEEVLPSGGGPSGGGGRGGGKRASVSRPIAGDFHLIGNTPCRKFNFEIGGSEDSESTINIKARIMDDGGASEAAAGQRNPEIMSLISPDGEMTTSADGSGIEGCKPGKYETSVSLPDGLAIQLTVSFK